MTEQLDRTSPGAGYLRHVADVMAENDVFLEEHAKETYNEVVELINDAIDQVAEMGRTRDAVGVSTSAMAAFAFHTVLPLGYAIYLDMLTANLPVCFMQLRLLLESLTKSRLADQRNPGPSFFPEKLESIESETWNISNLMREMDHLMDTRERFLTLWRNLSNEWAHTRGLTDRIVTRVQKGSVPPWALVVPSIYAKDDLEDLAELHTRISELRALLKAVQDAPNEASQDGRR